MEVFATDSAADEALTPSSVPAPMDLLQIQKEQDLALYALRNSNGGAYEVEPLEKAKRQETALFRYDDDISNQWNLLQSEINAAEMKLKNERRGLINILDSRIEQLGQSDNLLGIAGTISQVELQNDVRFELLNGEIVSGRIISEGLGNQARIIDASGTRRLINYADIVSIVESPKNGKVKSAEVVEEA